MNRQLLTKRNAYGAFYATLKRTGSIEQAAEERRRVEKVIKEQLKKGVLYGR